MFGVKSAGQNITAGQIIQQSAGNSGFSHTALVSTDENEGWFHFFVLNAGLDLPLTKPYGEKITKSNLKVKFIPAAR